jgi:hypothetical protein
MLVVRQTLNGPADIGANVSRHIDLFRDSPETGNQHVEQRRVTVDERGIVVSENLTPW